MRPVHWFPAEQYKSWNVITHRWNGFPAVAAELWRLKAVDVLLEGKKCCGGVALFQYEGGYNTYFII